MRVETADGDATPWSEAVRQVQQQTPRQRKQHGEDRRQRIGCSGGGNALPTADRCNVHRSFFVKKLLLAATFVWTAFATTASIAADARTDEIVTWPIQFARGASSATVKGSLKGYRIVDYRLGAKAGQTMSVKLTTSNGANYFNVLPPGSKDEAIFIGSTGGGEWTGSLPADGEYTIRVYLMRSAARRNETANYALTVGIRGSATPSPAALGAAPAGDAKVKGTPYHATGQVPCSMGNAPEGSQQCDFGVIRGKPGNAELHVTPPGGFERVLTFIGSKVTAGSGASVKASKTGDLWLVEVNDYEHYRIPEAVISGG
jgi:hypothetical protein